jgi:adenylate kinase
MRILITGTPGTGKTTFSLYFSNAHNYYYINVNELVSKYNLFLDYDYRRKSHIVDVNKVRYVLRNSLKNIRNVIIDTHIIEVVPKHIDFVVVFRLNPLKLKEILKSRGYDEIKIAENVEAEFLGVCASDAYKRFNNKVFELDVTDKTFSDIERFIFDVIESKIKSNVIDWMEILQKDEIEKLLSYLSRNR